MPAEEPVESSSAVRVRKRADEARVEVRVTPRSVLAIRPILLAVLWAMLTVAVVLSMIRGARAFLFIPFILLPIGRFYRALCAVVNRAVLTLDASRFLARQGPLPRGESLEVSTKKLRVFRAVPRNEPVGGWFMVGQTFPWTVKAIYHREGAETLELALPSKEVANEVADALNEQLDKLRTKTSYRG